MKQILKKKNVSLQHALWIGLDPGQHSLDGLEQVRFSSTMMALIVMPMMD